MSARKKFGEILVEAGVVKEVALRQALERQKLVGRRIGQVLESMGIISEKDIAVALSRQYGFRTVKDFARYSFPPEVLELIDGAKAKRAQIFPLKVESGNLLLAMVNPLDVAVLDEVSTRTKLRVVPCVTTPKEILAAIQAHYEAKEETGQAIAAAKAEWWSVLVADADKAQRARLVEFLKGQGYHVEEAGDGHEALGLALQLSPHLIVIDTSQPERLNAEDLYNSLRGTIPFIALGNGGIDEELELFSLGVNDYLSKPLHQGRLAARIKRALQLVYGGVKAEG